MMVEILQWILEAQWLHNKLLIASGKGAPAAYIVQ